MGNSTMKHSANTFQAIAYYAMACVLSLIQSIDLGGQNEVIFMEAVDLVCP